MEKKNLIIYQKTDGTIALEVSLKEDTVWLSQKQMAELFGKDKRTISHHILNIFKEGELERDLSVQYFRTVVKSGKTYDVEHYNLDVIISVGYRVKSKEGTQFRIWATNTLRDHLVQGYTINKQLLAEKTEKLYQLHHTIELLKRTADNSEIDINGAKGLFRVISEYSHALDLLDAYDHQRVELPETTQREAYLLTYKEAMELIDAMRDDFSTDLFGREKDKSFSGSLGAIYQTAFGEGVYPSIEEKGANLLYFVVKNHSFSDGNKRIAAAVFLHFMDRNKMLYFENGIKRISDETLVAITLMIAESKTSEKDVMTSILVNLIRGNSQI